MASTHAIRGETHGIGRRCYALQARKTANEVTRAYNDWLRPAGLEMAQFSTLAAILDGQAPSIAALAHSLGVERTTLVRNLKLMERRGLIAVAARTQRRLTHQLTPAGAQALARALPLWEQAQAAVAAALGQGAAPAGGSDVREAMRALRHALPVAFADGEALPEL
jgi:DNA-binding MarR family transcriptional regulator